MKPQSKLRKPPNLNVTPGAGASGTEVVMLAAKLTGASSARLQPPFHLTRGEKPNKRISRKWLLVLALKMEEPVLY